MPPRRKKSDKTAPAAPPQPHKAEKQQALRWRWQQSEHGGMVAERIDPAWGRTQAHADFYGAAPLLSTGEHMRSISSILTELVNQLNVHETEIAPELLAQAWLRAVGSFLATQAELANLANGQATVRTSHPAVRYELQQRKQAIIQALNRELGEGCVRKVRIVHG